MTNYEIVGQSRDNQGQITALDSIEALATAVTETVKVARNHEKRLSNLEDTMRVNGIQEKKITEKVNRVVLAALGGKKSQAYLDRSVRSRAYSEINRKIKSMFGIPRRAELPAKDYDECMVFIEGWRPDYELRQDIEETNSQLSLLEA